MVLSFRNPGVHYSRLLSALQNPSESEGRADGAVGRRSQARNPAAALLLPQLGVCCDQVAAANAQAATVQKTSEDAARASDTLQVIKVGHA